MDPSWTTVVVALMGVAVGTAAGVAFASSEHALRGPRAVSAGSDDGMVPVLAALRSTVVVLDEDDEVLRASASAYTFNIVRDDAVCEPQVARMVEQVRATGVVQDAEVTVARGRVQGAGSFYLHVRVAGIGNGRVLVLLEDLTAARRLEDVRRDFVANVSHELKTPVGAISLLAETVEEHADDPEVVRTFSGRMSKEAHRLGVLVQEIIELSRLQDGDALVSPERVDLDAVVAEAVDRVRVEAEAHQVSLLSGGQHGLTVLGDAALLTTAVRNLLDNAIRYSAARTRVSVGVSLDSQDPDLVRIAVVDAGIGIAKEDQERVFERFYRVDKARSRATGGTGLGLSIVKHVSADHGGTVELWSAPGRGSTFTLVLPRLREEAAGTLRPASTVTSPLGPAGRRRPDDVPCPPEADAGSATPAGATGPAGSSTTRDPGHLSSVPAADPAPHPTRSDT